MRNWNRSRRYRGRWSQGDRLAAGFVEWAGALFSGAVCGTGNLPIVVVFLAWLVIMLDVMPTVHVMWHLWTVRERWAARAREEMKGEQWATKIQMA